MEPKGSLPYLQGPAQGPVYEKLLTNKQCQTFNLNSLTHKVKTVIIIIITFLTVWTLVIFY